MNCMKRTLPLFALAASLSLVRPAAAAIDQGLLALVPESAVLVTSVDADATRSSDFGQYLLKRMDSEDQHLQRFVEDTGFDPRRDLQDLVFASFGQQRQAHSPTRYAILARGSFDTSRISATVKAKNSFTLQPYSGTTLYLKRAQGDNSAFAFPDTGVAVVGDVATVKAVLDRRASPSTLDPGLLQRINSVGASNDLWFASLLSGSFLGNQIDLPGAGGSQLKNSAALQSVLQSSGGVHFGDLVQLSFDAITRSPEDATSLTDVVRFLTSIVQTQRRSDATAAIIASALDNMQLQATGSNVHIALAVTEKNLELLAQSSAKRGQ